MEKVEEKATAIFADEEKVLSSVLVGTEEKPNVSESFVSCPEKHVQPRTKCEPSSFIPMNLPQSSSSAVSDEDSSVTSSRTSFVEPEQRSDVETIDTLLHQAQARLHTQNLTDSIVGLWSDIVACKEEARARVQEAEAKRAELEWKARQADELKSRLEETEACVVKLAEKCNKLEKERVSLASDAHELKKLQAEKRYLIEAKAKSEKEMMNNMNEFVNASIKTEQGYKNQLIEKDFRIAQLEEELRRLKEGDNGGIRVEESRGEEYHGEDNNHGREPVENAIENAHKDRQVLPSNVPENNEVASTQVSTLEARLCQRVVTAVKSKDTIKDEPRRRDELPDGQEGAETKLGIFRCSGGSNANTSTETAPDPIGALSSLSALTFGDDASEGGTESSISFF